LFGHKKTLGGSMPPQVHDRWPAAVREAFTEMNRDLECGNTASVGTGCERVTTILRAMDTAEADQRTRRQIAYSYYDLTYYFQQLGRVADTRWGYEQARNRWAALPADFETLTQQAACHNHLGLLALNEDHLTTATECFRAALSARESASRAQAHQTEQAENVVSSAGALCNLGIVYRERGDRIESARHYDRAIETLAQLLPADGESLDEEIRDLHMRMWQQIYGTPHWLRTARQFLANARSGKAMLEQGPKAEPDATPDPAA
jgi:tetratricopeptide (TPR) repeat protein